jgi:hypothetical protein
VRYIEIGDTGNAGRIGAREAWHGLRIAGGRMSR